MKWILVVLSFLVLFSGSAVAQLMPEDLDQIRQIVDKAIDTRISGLQNWLVGLTIGMFAITGSILIGSGALIIHVHSHTSKEVDQVRAFRDEITRGSLEHEESINKNVEKINKNAEKINKGIEEIEQTRLQTQEMLNQSREHSKRVLNLGEKILDNLETAISTLDKTESSDIENA